MADNPFVPTIPKPAAEAEGRGGPISLVHYEVEEGSPLDIMRFMALSHDNYESLVFVGRDTGGNVVVNHTSGLTAADAVLLLMEAIDQLRHPE